MEEMFKLWEQRSKEMLEDIEKPKFKNCDIAEEDISANNMADSKDIEKRDVKN
tara:strand:- start:263 stop:421 length:159 start_codon:yes stop_codon:yes gene_type:complete